MKHPLIDPTHDKTHLRPIVAPDVQMYLAGLHDGYDDPVLNAMEKEAAAKKFPIVGRQAGCFLATMAHTLSAKRIFEFGSGFGYSAWWFAKAVGANGKIICTDGDPENEAKAKNYLTDAGLADRVDFHAGWAQEIFNATSGQFDIIYNDVDKGDYPEVWRLARARLRIGGLYIADNVLWGGRVCRGPVVEDVFPGWTEAIREHNRLIAADANFTFFINPIRDGLIVARRHT